MNKTLGISAAAAALVLLGGCAAMRQLDSEVSSYSQWPAARGAATYTFERLPSQQTRPERQQALEDAARAARSKRPAFVRPARRPAPT